MAPNLAPRRGRGATRKARRISRLGRVAQWESARFTRERSHVLNTPRPLRKWPANPPLSQQALRPQASVRFPKNATAAFSLPFQMPSDLNPRLSPRDLAANIRCNRALQAVKDEQDRTRFEDVIAAHARARETALDELAEAHQAIADGWDFELTGDTRPAAMWQMMGRC